MVGDLYERFARYEPDGRLTIELAFDLPHVDCGPVVLRYRDKRAWRDWPADERVQLSRLLAGALLRYRHNFDDVVRGRLEGVEDVSALAVAPDGSVWVGDESAGVVWRIPPDGDEPEPIVGAAERIVPHDVCVDRRGNVYVVDSLSNRLYRIDGSTGTLRRVGLEGLLHPQAVATDRSDNVYVVDLGDLGVHRLLRIRVEDVLASQVPAHHTGGWERNVHVLAIDQGGNPWAADERRLIASDGGENRLTWPILDLASSPVWGIVATTKLALHRVVSADEKHTLIRGYSSRQPGFSRLASDPVTGAVLAFRPADATLVWI